MILCCRAIAVMAKEVSSSMTNDFMATILDHLPDLRRDHMLRITANSLHMIAALGGEKSLRDIRASLEKVTGRYI